MARVVIIGDPHFRVDNIQEVEMFIDRITNLVAVEKPDFVVCLGDLLHTHERLHTLVLNKAYDFVKRISSISKFFILVGNHDYIQNQQFLSENHWMNGMKEWDNVTIVDKVIDYKINGCDFVLLPYVPNGRFLEALNGKGGWESATCIFAHQEFYGCKMGAIISVDGDKWDESWPQIISGHIHSKQRPQPNIYYPGASIQTAFGESDENIIATVAFNPFKITETDLGLPRKKIVYTDLDSIDRIKTVDKTIKLSISGSDYNEFKAFKKTETYKNLIDLGTKVAFKLKQPAIVDVQKPTGEQDNDFKKILYDLVKNDSSLVEMYELVINKVETIIINT
jgi:DNA repair exonuclease SbcCD nuclease subunit